MKQLTFQFEGYQPASVKETPFSLHVTENVLTIQENVNARVRNLIERCTGAALTHRHAVGGVALMGGMALASGADSIPQALATLAAFAVAATCLNDLKEKGGEA